MRTGIGYDIHRLVEGRKLVLGGIEIVFERGLAGHSDADVLAHSICDALLGAACLGDIGTHFPDSDPAFRGISSMELLSNVMALVRERGYQLVNVDSVVLAERPKLAPFISAIRDRVAVFNGQAAVRPMMTLTLACDHRVVDGARAARFLDDVVCALDQRR